MTIETTIRSLPYRNHGTLEIVVGQPAGHATQEIEGVDVAILKTRLTFLKIGAHIRYTAVAQTQAEKEDFLLHPIEHAPGFSPIDLALFSDVELEWKENFSLPLFALGQVATHRTDAAGIAILIAQPLIDPRAGVALFAGLLTIGCYPGINNGKEGIQSRTRWRLLATVTGGMGMGQRFGNHIAGMTRFLGCLALGFTFDLDHSAYALVICHV